MCLHTATMSSGKIQREDGKYHTSPGEPEFGLRQELPSCQSLNVVLNIAEEVSTPHKPRLNSIINISDPTSG